MFSSNNNSKRRALSTVVGGMFMAIIMAGALNVMLWAVQQQDRVSAAVTEKANADIARLNEKIEISGVRIEGNGKLNVTVTNTGGQPARLASIYIVNETGAPKQQFRYDLDIAVDSRSSAAGIGQSLPFTANGNSLYSVKIVTRSGNSAASNIAPVSSLALPMSLYVIPPTVTPGENVTLLFTVSNNSTDSYLAGGVTPALSYGMSCSPPGPGCQLTQHAAPAGNAKIAKGATGMFKWVFRADAPDNTSITFNATLAGARPGNYVIEKGRVEVVDLSQQAAYSEVVISSELVQKPEIFLVVPSPFGEGAQQGLWGVVVVNPTNTQMEVSRIVVNVFVPHFGGSQKVFDKNCSKTPLYPAAAAEWTCIEENQLEWKDVASPEIVSPLGVKSFLARVEPGSLGSSADEPAFTVSVTVFTSMGQFAKTGYSGGMRYTNAPVTNVYLTDTSDPATALQDAHMLGHKANIASGAQSVSINVAVADFDTGSSRYVKSGTKLIVNVPKGFSNVAVSSYTGFVSTPTITPYTDGSTQIVATLAEHLGDTSSAAEAKVLSFTANAPVVPDKRIFIMHCLLDGETDTNFSVGAFSQVALQVVP